MEREEGGAFKPNPRAFISTTLTLPSSKPRATSSLKCGLAVPQVKSSDHRDLDQLGSSLSTPSRVFWRPVVGFKGQSHVELSAEVWARIWGKTKKRCDIAKRALARR